MIALAISDFQTMPLWALISNRHNAEIEWSKSPIVVFPNSSANNWPQTKINVDCSFTSVQKSLHHGASLRLRKVLGTISFDLSTGIVIRDQGLDTHKTFFTRQLPNGYQLSICLLEQNAPAVKIRWVDSMFEVTGLPMSGSERMALQYRYCKFQG